MSAPTLCAPVAPDADTRLRIRPEDTARLETHWDALHEQLGMLRLFVRPAVRSPS